MTESSELPTNAPNPRLCHIVKWPDFDGYGFNLHADKSRPGQYIGKVDEKSPADVAGLKEGDRIVEVNGVNISNENHKQVCVYDSLLLTIGLGIIIRRNITLGPKFWLVHAWDIRRGPTNQKPKTKKKNNNNKKLWIYFQFNFDQILN